MRESSPVSIDKNAVDLLNHPFPLFRSTGSSPWLWQVLQRSLIAIMMAVYVLTSAGCHGDSSASTKQTRSAQEAPAAREVKVVQAAQMPLERATVALGSLAAYDQATIGVKVPGRLRSIAVDFGSVVQQGALIAQIDPQDYQLRM